MLPFPFPHPTPSPNHWRRVTVRSGSLATQLQPRSPPAQGPASRAPSPRPMVSYATQSKHSYSLGTQHTGDNHILICSAQSLYSFVGEIEFLAGLLLCHPHLGRPRTFSAPPGASPVPTLLYAARAPDPRPHRLQRSSSPHRQFPGQN